MEPNPHNLGNTQTHPIVMSVDTGRDDAWTIMGMVNTGMNLSGLIATYGNARLDKTLRNTLDVLELAQKKTPTRVWSGPQNPLQPNLIAQEEIDRRWKTGGNGLSGVEIAHSTRKPDAETGDWLNHVQTYLQEMGPVTFINIGPFTALAQLVTHMGPDIHKYIDQVICMGGAFHTASVDFNLKADALAAQQVVTAFAQRLTLLPFDETQKLKLTVAEIDSLQSVDARSAFCKALMQGHARMTQMPDIMLHDPATLLVLNDSDLVTHESVRIRVQQDGTQTGRTIADDTGTPVTVIKFPDAFAARERILTKYLSLKL